MQGEHDIQDGSCVKCGMPESTAKWKKMAYAGCPGVRWRRVDDLASQPHLATETALRRQRLKPGGAPVACYYSMRAEEYRMLYDARDAVPVRAQTERQAAAREKALQKARTALTCSWCKLRVRSKSAMQQMADGHRLCTYCAQRWGIAAGVRAMLAAPAQYCILDSETTGLYAADGDELVEIAVLGLDGTPLLDTLIRPGRSIPPEASAIHGITDAGVADAPIFADVLPQLAAAVEGRTILIYNAAFDVGMVRAACQRLGVRSPVRSKKSVCMMEWYAEYVGIWSDYWGNYEWQPLDGDHRALGDCRAVLRLLLEMAQIPPSPYPAPDPVPETSQPEETAQ